MNEIAILRVSIKADLDAFKFIMILKSSPIDQILH